MAIKPSLVVLYASIFVALVAVISISYQSPDSTTALAGVSNADPKPSAISDTSVNEVVATSVAASVAEATSLPVASNVANLSVSLAAKNEVAPSSTTSISKQQIVQPSASRRDLVTYKAKAGDTVDAVAAQYGVSKETVKWANNLSTDALDEGKEIVVPPIDGVVYTVKDGDTVQSLADKYKASEERIIAFNDLEIAGLAKDQRIIIPSGQLPETERPGYVAPRSFSPIVNDGGSSYYHSGSVGNRYAYGYCTWYAYERRAAMGRPVGSFWGNANTWAAAARSQGYVVNNVPAPGAVFQTAYGGGGYGHVGIIESVDQAAGTVTYRDMNGSAGWNRVGFGTISIAEAQAQWMFIH